MPVPPKAHRYMRSEYPAVEIIAEGRISFYENITEYQHVGTSTLHHVTGVPSVPSHEKSYFNQIHGANPKYVRPPKVHCFLWQKPVTTPKPWNRNTHATRTCDYLESKQESKSTCSLDPRFPPVPFYSLLIPCIPPEMKRTRGSWRKPKPASASRSPSRSRSNDQLFQETESTYKLEPRERIFSQSSRTSTFWRVRFVVAECSACLKRFEAGGLRGGWSSSCPTDGQGENACGRRAHMRLKS